MSNIEKWTFALILALSYTGISVASLGKAMVTPFHLMMGFFIGYGILVSNKRQNTVFVSLLFLMIYVLFVNILQYPNIRYTSILYTLVYGIEFTILYNLLRRCRVSVVILVLEVIIISYLVNLFLGFVLDTINFKNGFILRFIRVYYNEKVVGGRPMGFSTEPSYASYILVVAFLCHSHLRHHKVDKTSIKLFIQLLLCIIFSKSAYGFVFVFAVLIDWGAVFYKTGDRLLRNIYPFILAIMLVGGIIVVQTSENESIERISKFGAALFDTSVTGKKKMQKLNEADGSAFVRIGPTYMLFNIEDKYEINFIIGEGAGAAGGFLAKFLVGIIVDEGRTSLDTGIIPAFAFDYGIIGTILLLIFLINCFHNLPFSFWLLFFLILPNANINTQLIWYNIILFLFVSIAKNKKKIMAKKRIMVDARCANGEGQGMLTYINGLYNAVEEQYGNIYELYVAGYDFEILKGVFPFLDRMHFIQLYSHSRIKLFFWEFPSVIKKHKIDYAHFQYVTPFVKNCQHIVTTHDVLFLDYPEEFGFWYRFKRKLLFFISLKRSDIRLTVSNYSKKRILEHFGVNQSTVGITPNAVSSIFHKAYNKKKAQFLLKQKYNIDNYILYVSRIERRKNHELLLTTYEALQLAQQGKQLVLIGNNTLNESILTKQIEHLQKKYPKKVHWLKYVNDKDLLLFYQGATLFVYPSRGEGFGIPPIEAGALGINTLCANNTAMEDFTFFEDNLFDVNDPKIFQTKLLNNLKTPPKTKKLGDISNKIKNFYSWEKSASVLHQYIQKSLILKPRTSKPLELVYQMNTYLIKIFN